MGIREGSSGPFKIETFDVVFDWPSVAAVTAPDNAITLAAARVGDQVLMRPLGVWPAGLTYPQAVCLVAGTIQARTGNVTAGALDPASQTYRVTLIHDAPAIEP